MAGRFELMIFVTGILTLAFIMACVSTGTDNWVDLSQSGRDPTIISLDAEQGLFERCVLKKYRSRMKSNNCYSLSSLTGLQKMKDWEKAVAGLMVTSTIIMGFAVLIAGFLMMSEHERTGILSDVSPAIIGIIAAIIAIIALTVYNSKYEEIRTKLTGPSSKEYADTEVNFGYSFYIGWLACFLHFFAIFFFFIYKSWVKYNLEQKRKSGLQYNMAKLRA